MTPKEKAKELAMKFDKQGETDNAKQCALIAVDEILNLCWNGNEVGIKYWNEVKQEIEKL
jgi:hypothetical protein